MQIGPCIPKQFPSYSRVIVRDFQTLKPVRDGENGLLQFLSPLPFSYLGGICADGRHTDGLWPETGSGWKNGNTFRSGR